MEKIASCSPGSSVEIRRAVVSATEPRCIWSGSGAAGSNTVTSLGTGLSRRSACQEDPPEPILTTAASKIAAQRFTDVVRERQPVLAAALAAHRQLAAAPVHVI